MTMGCLPILTIFVGRKITSGLVRLSPIQLFVKITALRNSSGQRDVLINPIYELSLRLFHAGGRG